MRKLLFLLAVLTAGCVSPAPEANAPINIRVMCGEKDQAKVEKDEPFNWTPSPGNVITPEENQRFYEIKPDSGILKFDTEDENFYIYPSDGYRYWENQLDDTIELLPYNGSTTLELN
jgi:hypothetical protein